MYTESDILSSDNVKINLRFWAGKDNNLPAIVVTHGYGEHQGYYEDFASFFQNAGYNVVTYDLRSYGRSEGKRGHVPSFDLFLDDLENVMKFTQNKYQVKKFHLFGHSLGGNIVANFLLKRSVDDVVKAVLSAPWFKLAFEPPRFKLLLAKIGNYFFPSVPVKGELKVEELSRDENFIRRYKNDPLTYDKISPSYFFAILEAGQYALKHANELKVPVLILHGDGDKVTSVQASKEFCDKAGDMCTFKLWTGGYRHVIFSEKDKNKVFEYIEEFLNP